MADDIGKSKEESALIQKETADLEVKQQELEKECKEKIELMNKQLED